MKDLKVLILNEVQEFMETHRLRSAKWKRFFQKAQ